MEGPPHLIPGVPKYVSIEDQVVDIFDGLPIDEVDDLPEMYDTAKLFENVISWEDMPVIEPVELSTTSTTTTTTTTITTTSEPIVTLFEEEDPEEQERRATVKKLGPVLKERNGKRVKVPRVKYDYWKASLRTYTNRIEEVEHEIEKLNIKLHGQQHTHAKLGMLIHWAMKEKLTLDVQYWGERVVETQKGEGNPLHLKELTTARNNLEQVVDLMRTLLTENERVNLESKMLKLEMELKELKMMWVITQAYAK